jgi:hypothetical protein
MARTDLTEQVITRAGFDDTPVAADAANGMAFTPGIKTQILVVYATSNSVTVTVPNPTLVDGHAVASASMVVGTSTTKFMGPWPDSFKQGDGKIYVDFSTATGVTVSLLAA